MMIMMIKIIMIMLIKITNPLADGLPTMPHLPQLVDGSGPRTARSARCRPDRQPAGLPRALYQSEKQLSASVPQYCSSWDAITRHWAERQERWHW